MKRLRTKIALALLVLVSISVSGTAFFTTRTFLRDKRSDVVNLNAVTAPNVAAALARQFEAIQAQSALLAELSGGRKTPQSLHGLRGVRELDLYRGPKRELAIPAAAGAPLDPLPPAVLQALGSISGAHLLSLANARGDTRLVLVWPRADRLCVAWLERSLFLDAFDVATALRISVVDSDGQVLATSAAEGEPLPFDAKPILQGSSAQGTTAHEIAIDARRRAFAAVAPIAGVAGVFVLVNASGEQISRVTETVLWASVPFVIAALLSTLLIAILISRQIARPLEELTAATSRIAAGEWQVPFSPESSAARDEVGRLIRAFGEMAVQLEGREAALSRANEELMRAESLAALGRFGAGVAHEVKNPLASISSYAQLLQRKVEPGTDPSRYTALILDETRRASRIVSDLLMFARQKTPERQSVDLAAFLRDSAEKLRPSAEAEGIAFEVETEIPPGTILEIDPEQIYQVLLNLVGNAIQAMAERTPASGARITLSAYSEPGLRGIRVADNGPGMPPEVLSRIFEPFFSTKEVGKGSGLGLSLCHGIMTQHEGTITVTSALGQGTQFMLSFTY